MKRVILCSLLLVLFVSSCSLSAIIPGNKASAPKALQYIFEVPSDPISVTVTLENENQAEALIPVAGGSLSVTGADGTVFRLDIPAGALVTDTFIRMIPVSKVDGMPFGTQAIYRSTGAGGSAVVRFWHPHNHPTTAASH